MEDFQGGRIVSPSGRTKKTGGGKPQVCAMGKAGEDFRQFGDCFIVVAWNISPFQVDSSATIFVKFPEPDREELHQLAGKILIWKSSDRGIRFSIF